MTWEEALGLLDKAADIYVKVTQPTYQPPMVVPTTAPVPTPTPTQEATDWSVIIKDLLAQGGAEEAVPEVSEERKPQIPWLWIIGGSIGVAIAIILIIALVK